MTEKPTETDAPEPQKTEAPPEAEKPKQPRDNFAELRRTKDREVAEANRSAKADRSALSEAKTKIADLESLYRESREKANFSDDDEGYVTRRNANSRAASLPPKLTSAHSR